MNELKIFENPEFGEIRTVEVNGEPWLVGKDVCLAFGDKNHNRTLSRIDDIDKCKQVIVDSLARKQNVVCVNESGLYSLLFTMQPQKAHNDGVSDEYPIEIQKRIEKLHRFKRWVTSEVLPAIRRTGGYIPTTPQMSEQEIMARAVQISMNTIAQQKEQLSKQAKQLEQQAPKVLFAESVASSSSSILVFDLAKLLKQNGINMGGNRLFTWLRENGYLVKRKGSDYNMPTQRSMNLGLFEIKESTHTHADGHVTVNRTPKVTGKGQIYFVSKFLQKELTHEVN